MKVYAQEVEATKGKSVVQARLDELAQKNKELKVKKQSTIARFLKATIESNYMKIKTVDMKFNIPALKKDMESKTSLIMARTFKK